MLSDAATLTGGICLIVWSVGLEHREGALQLKGDLQAHRQKRDSSSGSLRSGSLSIPSIGTEEG